MTPNPGFKVTVTFERQMEHFMSPHLVMEIILLLTR